MLLHMQSLCCHVHSNFVLPQFAIEPAGYIWYRIKTFSGHCLQVGLNHAYNLEQVACTTNDYQLFRWVMQASWLVEFPPTTRRWECIHHRGAWSITDVEAHVLVRALQSMSTPLVLNLRCHEAVRGQWCTVNESQWGWHQAVGWPGVNGLWDCCSQAQPLAHQIQHSYVAELSLVQPIVSTSSWCM